MAQLEDNQNTSDLINVGMVKAAAGRELGLDIDKTLELVDTQARKNGIQDLQGEMYALEAQRNELLKDRTGTPQEQRIKKAQAREIEKQMQVVYNQMLSAQNLQLNDEAIAKSAREIELDFAEGNGETQEDLQEWESPEERKNAVGGDGRPALTIEERRASVRRTSDYKKLMKTVQRQGLSKRDFELAELSVVEELMRSGRDQELLLDGGLVDMNKEFLRERVQRIEDRERGVTPRAGRPINRAEQARDQQIGPDGFMVDVEGGDVDPNNPVPASSRGVPGDKKVIPKYISH